MPQPAVASQISISKEEVAYWHREIESSQAFQTERFIKRINCEELIQYYEGNQYKELVAADQIAIINELFPAVYSVISATYNQNPVPTVKATHPLASKNIKPSLEYLFSPLSSSFKPFPLTDLIVGALKYLTHRSGMKFENKMALFDILTAGYAIVEVNYRTLTGERAKFEDIPQELNFADQLAERTLEGVKKLGKKMLGMESNKDDEEIAQEIEERTVPVEKEFDGDATFIKRWQPNLILFDYRAKTYKEQRWMSKIIDMPVAEFKNMYPEHKNIPEQTKQMMPFAKHQSADNARMVRVFEIEVKQKGQKPNEVIVIAPGIQEALDHYERPFTTNGFTLKYGTLDAYGTLYPISRMRLAKKAQDEINHYATIQTEHADRQLQKTAVFMGGLTENGQKAIHDNDVYGIVEKSIPGAVFEQAPQGASSPEQELLQQKYQENINKIIGSTELQQQGKSTSEFATQDALKQQAFQVSSSAVQDAMGDLVRDELDCAKDIIQQLWDGDDFFQITGLPGGDQWYIPEMGPIADLAIGDYLVTADMATAQRQNPLLERNETLELATFLMSEGVFGFMQSKGKTISIEFIEEVIKSYNKNPGVVLEDIGQGQDALGQDASGLGLGQGQVPLDDVGLGGGGAQLPL